jgi:hypothetical protein
MLVLQLKELLNVIERQIKIIKMFNHENLKESRESAHNHIRRYRLFGKSLREMSMVKRRYRTI